MAKRTHFTRSLVFLTSLLVCALSFPAPAAAQDGGIPSLAEAPRVASYTIQVQLDPSTHQLAGSERIRYTNTSSQPIPDLVFHLYMNAFRSTDSFFLREAGTQHRGYSWDAQNPGWIRVDRLSLSDGTPLEITEIEDGTLARAALPSPIAPGEHIELDADFTVQLPRVFARTGFAGDFYMVGQWFPKLGVWKDGAWNAYPFHANNEFFADFGDYDVSINLPQDFQVAASGLPLDVTPLEGGRKTAHYRAEAVIDFAWAASPSFREEKLQVGSTELVYVYLPEHEWTVKRVLAAAQAALLHYSQWFGPYPYPRLTVLDVPEDAEGAGGMEYPTLVTAGTMDSFGLGPATVEAGWDRSLELVTTHEIGHQWWQSVVAFNEPEEPWLDEGFTDYSAMRLTGELFGEQASAMQLDGFQAGYLDMRRMDYLSNPRITVLRPAWEFGEIDYATGAYSKPALSLLTLQNVLGEEKMDALMQAFYARYAFAHPTTDDFESMAREITGQDLDWFFKGLVRGDVALNYTVTAVDEDSVTVERQGELIIPTEVWVTFSDGSTLVEQWSGIETPKTWTYNSRPAVSGAEIDPQRKLVVDLRWVDNGLLRRADLSSWAALFVRLLYQVQNALLALGGL